MTDKRRMIFHSPLPLDRESSRASRFRPVKMYDAFDQIGYEVWPAVGFSRERSGQMREVRQALAAGVQFDFCYSESSTMPMTMCDPRHLPTHPLLDARFFRHLRGAGVPVGHFLRDIYWAFPGYREGVRPPKRELALAAYAWDMRVLRTSIDLLYVPSRQMAGYISTGSLKIAELPPAHDVANPAEGPAEGVHLLYVGDVGTFYRFENIVDAVTRAFVRGADVHLTICTREESWSRFRDSYAPFLSDAVSVVHAGGGELAALYERANIASLFVEPDQYWEFSVPVKMFEYIGYQKPILASAGSLSSAFVESEGVGWVLPYDDVAACVELLVALSVDPARIATAHERARAASERHSWQARAGQVSMELTAGR